ncbi:uncharacterized protein A4U43_C07F39250 [Asparagus officinalis]|uniref:Uncharacterized protein n=1 Tax=Asparagus officinalis TaxID=4686 RepID=A0A5P1ELI3_ASPOF|nr:uncharacterized protein A4U43_C07F39250 [Asparagus officinalis]
MKRRMKTREERAEREEQSRCLARGDAAAAGRRRDLARAAMEEESSFVGRGGWWLEGAEQSVDLPFSFIILGVNCRTHHLHGLPPPSLSTKGWTSFGLVRISYLALIALPNLMSRTNSTVNREAHLSDSGAPNFLNFWDVKARNRTNRAMVA